MRSQVCHFLVCWLVISLLYIVLDAQFLCRNLSLFHFILVETKYNL